MSSVIRVSVCPVRPCCVAAPPGVYVKSTCQLLRVFLPGNRESASVLLSRLPPVSLNRSVL